MAKASVVIPVHNGKKFINNAIKSAIAQSVTDIEIIIIDDASSDGTEDEIYRNFSDHIGNKIIYFKNDKNRERAFSRNKGYELSSGEYIFFLDYDDEWDTSYIESMVRFIEANKCDMAYSFQRTFIDETSRVLRVSKKKLPNDIGNAIFSSAVGYPTSTVFQRGAFSDYRTEYIPREDWEIFIRAYLNGLNIGIVDNNKTRIRGHEGRTSKKTFFWSSTKKIFEDYREKIPDPYKPDFFYHIGDVCLRFGDIAGGWKLITESIMIQPSILLDKRKVVSFLKRGCRIDKYFKYFKDRKALCRG